MTKTYNTIFYGLLGVVALFGVYIIGIRVGWFPSNDKITIMQKDGPDLYSNKWYIDFEGNIILVDKNTTVLSSNLNSILHEPKK